MRLLSALFLYVFFVPFCSATVIIEGTRVIYPESKKEVSVALSNKTDNPYLVQSWIDEGDANLNPSEIDVPFILTPPISRINGGDSQALKLIYTGETLPTDRESVFWLNVLSVPSKSDKEVNSLQIAYRTRIKLFFRPNDLSGKANETLDKLEWEQRSGYLSIKNPTPYHVSVTTVKFIVDGVEYNSNESEMMKPYSSSEFYFPDLKNLNQAGKVVFTAVNDYGSYKSVEWNLN
ncbi:MAG: molecular chaperone [Vibrio sp.]|uniref:fimbrial biogenesis chaperone n=1 Tax=Vibrio sp. TaxID=678 RepID=UPI003A896FE0